MKKKTKTILPIETVEITVKELRELKFFFAVKGRKMRCTREKGVARVTLFNFLLSGRVRRDILEKIRSFKAEYPIDE